MSIIEGKLEGKIIGTKQVLQNGQFDFPFRGRLNYTGPWLIFSDVSGYVYEVSLSDSVSILADEIYRGNAWAIVLEDNVYIIDDSISAVQTVTLVETLTDIMSNISDSIDSYKYIGYVFLKDGIKFEIKGHDQWRK